MSFDGFTGITSASVCGVGQTGVRSASVTESQGQDIRPADNDLWGKGALSGGASCQWSVGGDKPAHGLTLASTGTTSWTETQASSTKAFGIANCIVTSIGRNAVARGAGRGGTSISGVAFSSDGSASPVTWPS